MRRGALKAAGFSIFILVFMIPHQALAQPAYRIGVLGPTSFWTTSNLQNVMTSPPGAANWSLRSVARTELLYSGTLSDLNVLIVTEYFDRTWVNSAIQSNVANFVRAGKLLLIAPFYRMTPGQDTLLSGLSLNVIWTSGPFGCEYETALYSDLSLRIARIPNELSGGKDPSNGILAHLCSHENKFYAYGAEYVSWVNWLQYFPGYGWSSISSGGEFAYYDIYNGPSHGAVVVTAVDFTFSSPEAHRRLGENIIRYLDVLSPPQDPPVVELSPAPSVTANPSLRVTGRVLADAGLLKAELLLNGVSIDLTSAVGSNGAVQADVNLTEGANTIVLRATDRNGRVTSASANVRLKTTAPLVTFAGVPEITRSSALAFDATVVDASVSLRLTLFVNGVSVGEPPLSAGGQVNATVDLVEGSNTILLTAEDEVGNQGSGTAAVILDTLPASLYVRRPPGSGYVGQADFLVEGTASDLYGVASVVVSVDGVAQPVQLSDVAFALPVMLVEGPNQIQVVAEDRAGNVTSSSFQVILDSVPPEISVVWPADGSAVSRTEVRPVVRVNDASATSLWANGEPCAFNPMQTLFTCDVGLEEEGVHAIGFVAEDSAGNVSEVAISVLLDMTRPVLELTAFGELDPLPNTGAALGPQLNHVLPITLRVDALSGTTGTFAGLPFSTGRGGGTIFQALALIEGENVVEAVALSEAGLESSERWTITYDVTPPAGELDLPAFGRGVVSVLVQASDNLTGVREVVVRLDGTVLPPPTRGEDGSWAVDLDTEALTDGAHVLEATLIDGVGNISLVTKSLVVDNAPPSISLLSPSTQFVAGVVSIRASASDSTSGISELEVRARGRVVARCTDATECDASFDTSSEPDGPFAIEIRAVDRAANVSNTEEHRVAANGRPTKFLVSPYAGAVLRGTGMRVAVDIADPYFDEVRCSVDGVVLGSPSQDPRFEQQVALADLMDGTTTVSCTSRNLAGVETTEEVRVSIQNWSAKISPTTLNLSSKGGDNSVTLNLEGPNVGVLKDRGVLLAIGGRLVAATHQSTSGSANNPKIMFKVDRQQLITAIADNPAERRGGQGEPLELILKSGARTFGSTWISVK